MLLVLSLVYFLYLDRTGFSAGGQWLAGLRLLVGILVQSGGFFLHMLTGQPQQGSAGTLVTSLGALLIAVALVALAIGLIRARSGQGAASTASTV